MQGTITHINRRSGMFIIRTDDGDYTAWSLCDGFEPQIGSRIQGDLNALGGETLLDLARAERFQAVGESGPSGLAAVVTVIGPNYPQRLEGRKPLRDVPGLDDAVHFIRIAQQSQKMNGLLLRHRGNFHGGPVFG